MITYICQDISTDSQTPEYSTEPSDDCLNDIIYSDTAENVDYTEPTNKE